MFEAWKHKCGDIVMVFCCDSRMSRHKQTPKYPADSGVCSWLCDVCNHCNIGSFEYCVVGKRLDLYPVRSPYKNF